MEVCGGYEIRWLRLLDVVVHVDGCWWGNTPCQKWLPVRFIVTGTCTVELPLWTTVSDAILSRTAHS